MKKIKKIIKTSQFNDWGIVELEQGETALLHVKSLVEGYRSQGLYPFLFKNQFFGQLAEELKKAPLEIEGVIVDGRFDWAVIEKVTASRSWWCTNTGKIKIPLKNGKIAEPVGEILKGYRSDWSYLFLHYDAIIVWDKKMGCFTDEVEHPIKLKIEELISKLAPAGRGSEFVFQLLEELKKQGF